ncbi:MAG: RluA family pseudouridine synthase [Pyrinomonadaceae bacterium]
MKANAKKHIINSSILDVHPSSLILHPSEASSEAPSEILAFEIAPEDVGTRLDVYLAARIAAASRARVQRLIESGDVLVGEKPASRSSYKLRPGDHVEVEVVEAAIADELVPENIPLDILYEDEHLIVVNKSAGMVVHPGAGVSTGTLAHALLYHFAELATRGGAARPGIVHRLDRETSGVILVAKTEAAHENLSQQFRDRSVFKSYLALVHGQVKAESGSINEPIARDRRHRTRMGVVRGGREALSLYRVRERFARMTLLNVEIKTGRTHQIRVHLAHLKHPVVGDELYGGGRDQTVADVRVRQRVAALGHQFLHAERLAFRHPASDQELRFKAPLPADLTEFLDFLREPNDGAA